MIGSSDWLDTVQVYNHAGAFTPMWNCCSINMVHKSIDSNNNSFVHMFSHVDIHIHQRRAIRREFKPVNLPDVGSMSRENRYLV